MGCVSVRVLHTARARGQRQGVPLLWGLCRTPFLARKPGQCGVADEFWLKDCGKEGDE